MIKYTNDTILFLKSVMGKGSDGTDCVSKMKAESRIHSFEKGGNKCC